MPLILKMTVGELGARFRVGDTIIEIIRIGESKVHLACDGPDAIQKLDHSQIRGREKKDS